MWNNEGTINCYSNVCTHRGNILINEPCKIKKHITTLIQNEDKKYPLTDEQLMEKLSDMNYSIARRTVSKYRESLKNN